MWRRSCKVCAHVRRCGVKGVEGPVLALGAGRVTGTDFVYVAIRNQASDIVGADGHTEVLQNLCRWPPTLHNSTHPNKGVIGDCC